MREGRYAKLTRLHKRDPLCYYCGGLTVLRKKLPYDKQHRPNDATLEHLVDRYDPRRSKPLPGERRIVLACSHCNNEQNAKRQREIPIEILRARATHASTRI